MLEQVDIVAASESMAVLEDDLLESASFIVEKRLEDCFKLLFAGVGICQIELSQILALTADDCHHFKKRTTIITNKRNGSDIEFLAKLC